MSRLPTRPTRRWQSLLAPMLLFSLGLHGVFLLIPTASSDEPAIPPPDPEEETIAITRIPPSQPEAPVPVAAAPPAAASAAAPVAVATTPARPTPRRSTASTARPRPSRTAVSPRRRSPTPTPSQPPARSAPLNPGNPYRPPSMVIEPLPAEQRQEILAYLKTVEFPTGFLERLQAQLAKRHGYSAADTSRTEYGENVDRWLAQVQQAADMSDLDEDRYREDVQLVHSRRVCYSPEPRAPVVGVVVQPDGSVMGEPTVLRSSGYGQINEEAAATVAEVRFPADEEIKAYTVEVDVTVDYGRYDCLRLEGTAEPD